VRTRIKFCGCTSWNDVTLALDAGVDAIGMIFAPSPRRIAESQAHVIARQLPPFVTPVGVFVDPSRDEIERIREIFPNLVVQLSGDESPEFVASLATPTIKALHVEREESSPKRVSERAAAFPYALLLFDTKIDGVAGGTGESFAWGALASVAKERPIVVAGGLKPENVGACVREVRPFAVDVRSGIETDGVKDPAKMRAFVRAVRESDET
jgi:phosphoribosylanthranilate isomerase